MEGSFVEIGLRKGKIIEVTESGLVAKIMVETDIGIRETLSYTSLTGPVKQGDTVVINTTAVDLNLGSGGADFVLINLDNLPLIIKKSGHIMKLRYTPLQLKVWAEEEKQELPLEIKNPVILAELHSMLLPAALGVWAYNPKLTVGYIMTDGGALPIDYSQNVKRLKEIGYSFLTFTSGHAFGGDREAVTFYSALSLASRECDVIIAGMGPGVVGTSSIYGTTAIEVGTGINAVSALGGRPIVIPRIMQADKRERHSGLSHHTLTSLKIALAPSEVVFSDRKWVALDLAPHKVVICKFPHLDYGAFSLKTMKRGYGEETEFFQTAAAAGSFAASVLV